MADDRKKNFRWGIKTNTDGTTPQMDAHLAVLMDIRDELQTLNRLLGCQNFLSIPSKLDAIRRNTTKAKRKPRLRAVS